MTTVESKDVAVDTADNKDTKEDADEVDIPSDFFDEFEDSKFLDEIVEIVVPEQARLVRTGDRTNENSMETNDDNADAEDSAEPTLKRCLEKINDLTRSIERRKQRLQNNSLTKANKRQRRSHTRSPPPATNRVERNVKSRDRERRFSPRRSPSGPRSGRRCRSRSRDRNRDRRSTRRDRSASSYKISFLEELKQKGIDVSEKDVLAGLRSKENSAPATDRQMATVGYPSCEMPLTMAPYVANVPMPTYNQPSYQPPYWNGNYMLNPMAISMQQHTMLQFPFQAICTPSVPPTNNVIQNGAKAIDKNERSIKDEVIARCRGASKILRGEENKVPKLRFLFTRTTVPADTGEGEVPPLQSRKNVDFKETSANEKSCAPLQFLPPRTSELVKILGYNCSAMLNRLRLKNVAKKVVNEIEDMDAEKQRSKERKFKETDTQTDSYKCPTCVVRDSKSFSNKSTQAEAPKKVSIRTQTNEKDYRQPLIRQLTRMSAGQLVAVSDFISLICEPRPTTSTEIFSVREKLMDIYNLSERGAEAIEAERSREHETRRRGNNNCSMPSPPMEDLRASIRGSSDHNMGRIPPPPPLLVNYNMNAAMIDQEQAEREMRMQQMRYEENMRAMQMEEQRNRELEWERQQQQQQQQHIVQQQRQMQLQHEEEEMARLQELRNDRRINFERSVPHWNHRRY